MITKNGTVIRIITSFTGEGRLSLKSKKDIISADFTVTQKDKGFILNKTYSKCGKDFIDDFWIDDALVWNTKTPNLYEYKLKLVYLGETETVTEKFAFRTITATSNQICLNDEPCFIRGYIRGAKAHEHENNAEISEREYYYKNISEAKKFGFNLIRFHSVVPNETFFEVADELGILVHIELRSEQDEYNNVEEMTTGKVVIIGDEYVKDKIDRLYNHPSLAVYCIGNELRNPSQNARVLELSKLIKSYDATRLFIDTCAWGAYDRENVDINVQHLSYYFPYAKHADMYTNYDSLLVCGSADGSKLSEEGLNSSAWKYLYFNTPLIAHEVCHYTALRDFKLLKKKFALNHKKAPWWVDEEIKLIDEKGLTKIYPKMFMASKTFQFECWKTAFEKLRLSSILNGFHFLQFADTDAYENSNGVVDCFDEENYLTPENFIKFNGDEILLADFPSRIFEGGKEVCFPIFFSEFGSKKRGKGDFEYSFTSANGKVYASGKLNRVDISRSGLYCICKVALTLPSDVPSDKLTFKVSLLENGELICDNAWKLYVYNPKFKGDYDSFVNYSNGNLLITDDVEKAFLSLEEGKNVCLVYRSDYTRHLIHQDMPSPKYSFKATWNRFKPVIWDRGTNYGGLCNSELLKKHGFFSDEFYDFNYSVLTEDCDKIILDDFPVKVNNIVAGIDKSTRDRFDAYKTYFNLPELMPDRTLRDFSYAFEVQVGKGKLFVTGMNLLGLNDKEPSSRSMADFIIEYLSSKDFAPSGSISLADLKAYMKKCAEKPVRERMMTQFWQLDDTPVESSEYWKDSEKYCKEEQ